MDRNKSKDAQQDKDRMNVNMYTTNVERQNMTNKSHFSILSLFGIIFRHVVSHIFPFFLSSGSSSDMSDGATELASSVILPRCVGGERTKP